MPNVRSLERLVRRRALGCCEYCGLPEQYSSAPFQMDHIIAEQHRGPTVPSNLALACCACNHHKGPNLEKGKGTEKGKGKQLIVSDQDKSCVQGVTLFSPPNCGWLIP